MRQHGLPDDVTDGIHSRHVRLQTIVDFDFPFGSEFHADVFQPDSVGMAAPAHRDQNRVTIQSFSVGQFRAYSHVRLFDGLHRVSGHDSYVTFLQLTFDKRRNLFIFQWQQTGHHFHHRHVRPQPGVQGGELTPFNSPADDEQPIGHSWYLQGFLARHDVMSIHGKHRKGRRRRTRRDDDGIRLNGRFTAIGKRHSHGLVIDQSPSPPDVRHSPLFQQRGNALDQSTHDPVFSLHHL